MTIRPQQESWCLGKLQILSGNAKGKGKGKGKWGSRFCKPLAQRILESEWRRCGQKGHWKAECPLACSSGAQSNSNSKEIGAFAGTLDVIDGEAESDMPLQPRPCVMSKSCLQAVMTV